MARLVLLRNVSASVALGQHRNLSLAALRSFQRLAFAADSRANNKVRSFSIRAKKTADNGAIESKRSSIAIQDAKNVVAVELQKEAAESYLAYAMSVTVGRALPDIRDGLKPVHRRILYAMHELGLSSTKPFKKCARVVGEVLGKFHPHGDAAVYDALVRLAQSFSLRSPLISGHGNFGSLDGDPAAAMRYTECRLEPLSEAMLLADLDLKTVDFLKNFDGSHEEPYLMPARLPNLLINGATGIAVGMATSIPPHNLSEVVDALCTLIRNPNVTVQELMEHLPAPDFPTGGIILGSSGILGAYSTGRGQFIVRGKVMEECDEESGRQSLVITEIPYNTNKAALVTRIASLVNNKTLEGVSDVRDESDRSGTRVVVELKKGTIPAVVLNNLYRHTTLQSRFSCNMIGILNEQPLMFGLKELLEKFLEFRCNVVERRAKFELKQAEERDHLLQGFLKGLERLDDVVKMLRESKDSHSALEKLEEDFGLSKVQAEGILSMPLRRITSLEKGKIEEEHSKLVAQVKELQTLLSSKQRILQVVEKEAVALKKEFGTPRRTVIEQGHDGHISDMDVVANDEALLTLSERGYIKRMQPDVFSAQRRGTVGKSGAKIKSNDGIVDTFVCKSHDHILLFSDKGVVYSLRAYQVPECSRNTAGVPIVQILPLPADERITSMFPLSEFQEDQFLVMLTSQGYIKRTPIAAFSSIRPQGIVAIHLTAGDELRWVRQATEHDNIFIGTQGGMVVQIPCGFRAMHRSARGVRAMRLKGVDRLAAIDIVPGSLLTNAKSDSPPWLLLITENGIAKRVPVADFPLNSLNRTGVIGSKFQPGDRLASLHVVGKETQSDGETGEQVVVGTVGGRFNRFRVRDVPVRSRMAIGVRLMKLDSPDKVKSVALVSSSDAGSGSAEHEVAAVEAAEPAEA